MFPPVHSSDIKYTFPPAALAAPACTSPRYAAASVLPMYTFPPVAFAILAYTSHRCAAASVLLRNMQPLLLLPAHLLALRGEGGCSSNPSSRGDSPLYLRYYYQQSQVTVLPSFTIIGLFVINCRFFLQGRNKPR